MQRQVFHATESRFAGTGPAEPLSAKQIESMRKRGVEVDDDAMSPASSLVQFRNIDIKPIDE